MSDVLSKDYVPELIKCTLTNNKILDICARHLKYEYLQTEAQKKIVKYIFDTFLLTGNSPTIGTIAQAYPANKDVIGLLGKIKSLKIDGKEDTILESLEKFIKDIRYQSLLKKSADLYNAEKVDEAVKLLRDESTAIEDFNLKDKYYTKVFGGFNDRVTERRSITADETKAILKQKLGTGIHDMDEIFGGFQKGRSFLAMSRSGIGKSTYLRWVALCNARMGKRVVFFQAEDTEENALEAFDSAWTALTGQDTEDGNVPPHLKGLIERTRREIMARGGEIILIAAEDMERMSIEKAEEMLLEIIKIEGPVDMALFDYLEIFTVKGQYGKGDSAERNRREAIANKMTGLATKYKIVVGTATQSNDIEPEKVNNPDWVITRHNASECKGVIKPFSYFFTFNCTRDEYKQQILRVYIDKLRKNESGQIIKIYQSRNNGRFYDAVKTKNTFDEYNKSQYSHAA